MVKQQSWGDVSPNYDGNNGYGYEEHEQYVASPESESHTGGVIEHPDNVGVQENDEYYEEHEHVAVQENDEYGYEEHEQYVDIPEESKRGVNLDSSLIDGVAVDESRIMISAGMQAGAVSALADTWRMEYEGSAFYDNGEPMTEENIAENTAMFYKDEIPNKTAAFIKAVKSEFPDVHIEQTSILGPDEDMNLDLDGLDEGLEL